MDHSAILISNLLDTHQALTVAYDADQTIDGAAFVSDLIRMVEKERPIRVQIGTYGFETDLEHVIAANDVISFAEIEIDPRKISNGDFGDYRYAFTGVHDGELVTERLRLNVQLT